MSRRVLWILTISLSLVLLGLIVIQMQWIKSALDLKDKQFQQLVNTSLLDVSRQLEQYYTSVRMKDVLEAQELANETVLEWTIAPEPANVPDIQIQSGEEQVLRVGTDRKLRTDTIVPVNGDTLVIVTSGDGSITDTIVVTEYIDQDALTKLERSLEEREMLVSTVMKKMLLEEIIFEKRISQEYLEEVIAKNLSDRGVNLEFEYLVLRDNKYVIYASDSFIKETDNYYFRTGLMSDMSIDDNTYLYVYFPGQKKLVRGSLGFLSTSTMLLTLLMIILFIFALYVIFRQKRLSDVKNDFVNNMTHELKTPISTISLASQMLSDESIPSEQKNIGHISRIIQTESKRLGYQVERVLQMAVLDQGHLVLKRTEMRMDEIVAAVVQNFRIQVESRKGKLEVISEAEMDAVYGDRVHLMNVLTNLMDNAVKYSPDLPEITIKTYNSKSYFVISVQDNGIGISKEDQKRVFDKFYRVSTGNVHDVKGFGLGLSYVKLIIEQHGGIITVNSELQKGTQFEIKIPLFTDKEQS